MQRLTHERMRLAGALPLLGSAGAPRRSTLTATCLPGQPACSASWLGMVPGPR